MVVDGALLSQHLALLQVAQRDEVRQDPDFFGRQLGGEARRAQCIGSGRIVHGEVLRSERVRSPGSPPAPWMRSARAT